MNIAFKELSNSAAQYGAIKECFDTYEKEVSQRINDDITSRKSELDNLLQQKKTREINRESEFKRFKNLQEIVIEQLKKNRNCLQQLISIL
jgi:hypothetical protein